MTIRRSTAYAPLLLAFLAGPASGQGVPTLNLGSSASVQLVPPGPITADGKRISLLLVASDETGQLANGVKFRGSATNQGRLDADCNQIGPGLYDCGYSTPEKAVRGVELRVRARLASGNELSAAFPLEVVPDSRARVTFTAAPDQIILSQDPSSSVVFSVTDDAGNPVEGLNLKAASNVGEVQALTSAGGGRWSAVYVPPSTPFPQVALISVWDGNDPDNVFGFFRIPLIGKVNYPVRAGIPGVTLIFKVGDSTFPPVVADASGNASVPITVPPGVPSASVELIQPNGARSTQTIDLQVPPFNRVSLGGVPDFLTADGKSQAKVRIAIVDKRGKFADGAQLSLVATQGQVSAVQFVGNGLYEAVYTAPEMESSSKATLTASLVGEEAASSDSVEIGLEPGGPGQVALSYEPTSITPNVNKVTLTAKLLAEDGGPAKGTHTVEFRTAEGPLKNPKVVSPGVFSAELPVTWNVKTRVQVLAGIRGNRQAVSQIVALPLADQVLTGQKMPISVVTLDRYGNPVADVAVNAAVEMGGGSVTGSVQTDARGVGTVLYSAGPASGLATIRFSTNGHSYSAPIWQTTALRDEFEFPVAGGQKQGRALARWRKLRAAVSFGGAPAVAEAPAATSGPGLWGGAAPVETSTPVVADSGSVAKAGAATGIQVSLVPESVPETGGTVNIIVRVVNQQGLLVPGEKVILLADAGVLANKVDNGDGTWSAVLTVPANLGRPSVQVTATRPAGDLAGYSTLRIGGAAVAASSTKAPKEPRQKPARAAATAPAGDDARKKHRRFQAWATWAPGGDRYDSHPCVDTEGGPCDEPAESTLDDYDFLKVAIRAPTWGSVGVGVEGFPLQDAGGWFSLGGRLTWSMLSYTTTFEADSGSESYCGTHYCDQMNFVNADLEARIAALPSKGPLDILIRPIGYQYQDLVIFRRLWNPSADARTPQFETVHLHGLRFGIGARYTIIPQVRPHIDYDLAIGIQATLGDASFGVPGVTNHHFAFGVNVFPVGPLMVDIGYDLTTRSMGFAYANEEGVAQRGTMSEQAHTLRLSAGVAF